MEAKLRAPKTKPENTPRQNPSFSTVNRVAIQEKLLGKLGRQ
jgi:hypothetical protein